MDDGGVAEQAPPAHAFRRDIQGLRAIAVTLVVLNHVGVRALDGGFVGVDVFFVISGFLITGLLLADVSNGRVRFSQFYARRMLRILPVATLVILATGITSIFVLNLERAKEVLTDSIWTSLFVANVKFSQEGTDYFSQVAVSPLQHFWSLSVEEQFYLVWPALLALGVFALPVLWSRRHSRASRGARQPIPRGRLTVILLVGAVASFLYSIHLGREYPSKAYFSTMGRAWELIAGALLAVGLPQLGRLPVAVRALLTWAGVAAIGFAAVSFNAQTPFPDTAALLPVCGACAVLVGGIDAPRGGANRWLGRQPLGFIGDISYSLYLWHWPLLVLGAAYAGHSLSGAQKALLMLAALWLSVACLIWIETPLRRGRQFWEKRPKATLLVWPLAVAAVLLMVAVGGALAGSAPVRSRSVTAPTVVAGATEVRASVTAALRGAKIPSDLDPSLNRVLQDQTTIGDCSGYDQTQNKICQYGDPKGTKKVVLFGNSHAVAWLPAIAPVATAAGWQLLPVVKEACDYGEFQGSDRNSQCGVWYTWARAEIERLKPDVIILNGYAVGGEWQTALTRTVQELRPLASRMIILSDPPGVTVPPVDCLQRPKATLATCLSVLSGDTVRADQIQATIAAKAEASFVDVQPWFCDRQRCPNVVGNIVTYVDTEHITETYSRHLSPVMRTQLKLH